ncbi:MAG: carbohydrate ABC transporter permease [Sphaerochaetaceae bacterium]|nr:carbohydrate ABC transporter permease [Sphaerochaetaceae bacterium]
MKRHRVSPVRVGLIVLIAAINIFPFLWMLSNSFNTEKGIFSTSVQLIPDLLFTSRMFENYLTVITEFNFGRYTMNSIFVASMSSLGQLIVCSMAGFTFAKMKFKGKNLIFALVIFTLMVPNEVAIIPEYYLMMRLGWLDTYLPLIVPSFLIGAMGTFLLKEFFEQVPDELFDAGIIDGANSWVMYRSIYLPQGIATMATLFIIAFMNNWNDLLRPILYLSKNSLMTVTQALTQFQGQYEAKWNLLLTGSVLSILPLIAMFIFTQRYIIDNSMNSGIKG